jgi:hypothetical protein
MQRIATGIFPGGRFRYSTKTSRYQSGQLPRSPFLDSFRFADHTETTLDPTDYRPATITRDSFRILRSFDTTPSLLSEIRPELQYCCRKIDIIVCSRRNALFIGFGRVVLRKLGLAIIQ